MANGRRLPDRTKFALTLGAVLVLAIVATSLLNYQVSRDSVRREILSSALPLTRDTIYSEVHSSLMQPIVVSSIMAHDTFLKDWAVEGETHVGKVVRYLQEIKEKYGFFTTFFVSARTYNYYHFNGILKRLSREDSHDVWFYDFIDSGLEYTLDVDTNEAAENVLTIFINFRVNDSNGNLLGVTGVGLKLDMVAELLEETEEKYGRKVFFVDQDGLVQAHPDSSLVENARLQEMGGLDALAPEILSQTVEPASFEYDAHGKHYLLSIRYIPEFKWFLIVQEDETEALASARNNLVRTLAIGLATALVVVLFSLFTLNRYQRRLEYLATTDELTGAANRRVLEERFFLALARAERTNEPFSLILMDLDGLKAVNDHSGHLAGDRVIREVADLAREAVRPMDLLARWGGDEFVILAECGRGQAASMAERIREKVQAAGPGSKAIQGGVTVSCGVSEHLPGEDLDGLIRRADKALYSCKEGGRNRVECA